MFIDMATSAVGITSVPSSPASSESALPSAPVSALCPDSATPSIENEGLLEYVRRSVQDDEDFHFMRFESLQRTNLVALQVKLVCLKDTLRKEKDISNSDLELLRSTLEQYSTAIENYHFLRQRKSLAKKDESRKRLLLQRYFQSQVSDISSFHSHYAYFDEASGKVDDLRLALMKSLPAWMTYSRNERASRKREFAEGRPPKEVSAFVDRLCRFLIAAVGGSFLVGPMLIMALDSSTKKSLITVSASVLLFIAVLTFGVRVSNIEALVSTATYAAVLVVFVGTSTGSGDGSSQ